MNKNTVKEWIEILVFDKILAFFLFFYEKHIMYRIKNAWGKVHLKNIVNKGENVKIVGYSRFLDPDNLRLGDNVQIGYDCFFFCKGGITIGNNTILSRNIVIYSSNHDYMGDAIPYNNDYVNKPVVIGKGVWIGMGVMIVPGVTIGDGAIIGMGTVVSKDVSDGEVIVGSSQRKISIRNMNRFRELETEDKIFSILWPTS